MPSYPIWGFIQLNEYDDYQIDSLGVVLRMFWTTWKRSVFSPHKESAICIWEWQKIAFSKACEMLHSVFQEALQPCSEHIWRNFSYLLTHSMEQSPSWEANRFAASQEISRILWNPITDFTSVCHLSLTWAYVPSYQSWSEASVHDSKQNQFSRWGVVNNSPKPQARGPPLVDCPPQLIQYIRSYLPYLRPFLHPQHENAPCRDDMDPIITVVCHMSVLFMYS
jgi:hypothetical protein